MTTVWFPQKRHRVVATDIAEAHVRLELHDHRATPSTLRATVDVVGGGGPASAVVHVESCGDALYEAAVRLAMARLEAGLRHVVVMTRVHDDGNDDVLTSLIDEAGCIELLEYEAPPQPSPPQRKRRAVAATEQPTRRSKRRAQLQ